MYTLQSRANVCRHVRAMTLYYTRRCLYMWRRWQSVMLVPHIMQSISSNKRIYSLTQLAPKHHDRLRTVLFSTIVYDVECRPQRAPTTTKCRPRRVVRIVQFCYPLRFRHHNCAGRRGVDPDHPGLYLSGDDLRRSSMRVWYVSNACCCMYV